KMPQQRHVERCCSGDKKFYWCPVAPSILVCPIPIVINQKRRVLEQRIDEWRQSGAAEDYEQADQQQDDDDRGQPPFLVVHQEIEQLAKEAALRGGRLGGEIFGGGLGLRTDRLRHDDKLLGMFRT